MALEARDGKTIIRVKAVPGASRASIDGLLADRIKIRVSAPPEGGKANSALLSLLATELGVRKGDLSVIAGSSSPKKSILVEALDPSEVDSCLRRYWMKKQEG